MHISSGLRLRQNPVCVSEIPVMVSVSVKEVSSAVTCTTGQTEQGTSTCVSLKSAPLVSHFGWMVGWLVGWLYIYLQIQYTTIIHTKKITPKHNNQYKTQYTNSYA